MEDQEIKTPAKTLVDTDGSARLTIVLDGPGDSTPAPAQFRMKPLATGTSGYSWAARVDKLTERLDKLQLRVEALEDSFEDPDDPTKDELDKLATLQRARESLLVELRAAKEQLSGPSSRGASPKRDAAAAAPSVNTVAKISATPKYPPYPSDVAHPTGDILYFTGEGGMSHVGGVRRVLGCRRNLRDRGDGGSCRGCVALRRSPPARGT